MAIVSDSSPLISLAKIARLEMLRKLYERVIIPPSVYQETLIEGKRLCKAGVEEIENALQTGWLELAAFNRTQLNEVKKYMAVGNMGKGEVEAIVLARSHKLPLVVDDRYARTLSASLGLEFFGTASILLEAYIRKLINKKDFMESLRELAKNMWLSPSVISEMVRQAEEVEK